MPDIRIPARFTRKMIQLENKYLADVTRVCKAGRRSMLDILTSNGIKYSAIALLQREISEIGRQSSAIGREMSNLLDEIVIWNMQRQLRLLSDVGEKTPDINQLNIATGVERKRIYEILTSEPQWAGVMAKSISVNMTRLAAANADLSTAVDRLLTISVTDGRASVWRLSTAAAQKEIRTSIWAAGMGAMGILYRATRTITRTEYKKQAIAAIDAKTTDCCLQVHGQIQPLDKPFELTGTPRFADKIDNPPFHWYCRTSESLYTEKMEEKGVPTAEMKESARAEQEAREETGYRERIHPSYATSRRK